jgi:hypothetical protein
MPSANFGKEVLKSTVFRFAPETQKLKTEALDQIIENTIHRLGGAVSEKEVTNLLSGEGGIVPGPKAVIKSIDRLHAAARIEKSEKEVDKFQLSDETSREIELRFTVAEKNLDRVLSHLLKDKSDEKKYRSLFSDVIAHVFTELGEESIAVLESSSADGPSAKTVTQYCGKIANNDEERDKLTWLVIKFFDSDEPFCNTLKWRYAQSFFIAKSIGVDSGGQSLGYETFKNSTFYIDTNVAIPAVEPADHLHESFKLLQRLSSQLNCKFEICTHTLEELNDWATNKYKEVTNILDRVTPTTFAKADSLFAKICKSQIEADNYDGPNSLFENLNDAQDILEKENNVSVLRNRWFVEKEKNTKETKKLVGLVRSASQIHRDQDKNAQYQALHDALLIRWILHQRKDGYNAWLLTADTSLPRVRIGSDTEGGVALTLDALFQWLSPIAGTTEDSESFQKAFAELVKSRLLPQDNIFTLKDLSIFADLGVSVKDLPQSDVESALKVVNNYSGKLDMSDAEDRETMMHELRKILSSPERTYKKRLRRQEEKSEEHKNTIEEVKAESERKDRKIEGLEAKIDKLDGIVSASAKQYESLKANIDKEKRKNGLRASAYKRIGLLIGLLVLEVSGIVALSLVYGDQEQTFLKRLLEYWPLMTVALLTVSIFAVFGLSKEHLRAVGLFPSSVEDS